MGRPLPDPTLEVCGSKKSNHGRLPVLSAFDPTGHLRPPTPPVRRGTPLQLRGLNWSPGAVSHNPRTHGPVAVIRTDGAVGAQHGRGVFAEGRGSRLAQAVRNDGLDFDDNYQVTTIERK